MAKIGNKQIDLVLLDAWKDQCRQESIAWHKANNTALDEKSLIAFTAGFNGGWRECLKTLRAQGFMSCNS